MTYKLKIIGKILKNSKLKVIGTSNSLYWEEHNEYKMGCE